MAIDKRTSWMPPRRRKSTYTSPNCARRLIAHVRSSSISRRGCRCGQRRGWQLKSTAHRKRRTARCHLWHLRSWARAAAQRCTASWCASTVTDRRWSRLEELKVSRSVSSWPEEQLATWKVRFHFTAFLARLFAIECLVFAHLVCIQIPHSHLEGLKRNCK